MMLLMRGDPDEMPGTWRRWHVGRYRSAVVSCPRCGTEHGLVVSDIDGAGRVTPDFGCRSCTFRAAIQLDGWSA